MRFAIIIIKARQRLILSELVGNRNAIDVVKATPIVFTEKICYNTTKGMGKSLWSPYEMTIETALKMP